MICKYCQSERMRKYGKYEETQYYYCNDCRRKFVPNDSLFHMKTPANQVSSALDMYYKGLSITEIREHLQQDAQALMEKATKIAGKAPKVVVTDKLAAYLDG